MGDKDPFVDKARPKGFEFLTSLIDKNQSKGCVNLYECCTKAAIVMCLAHKLDSGRDNRFWCP